jgi:hypothetical protein
MRRADIIAVVIGGPLFAVALVALFFVGTLVLGG